MKAIARKLTVIMATVLAAACTGYTRDATDVTGVSASLNGAGTCAETACDTYFEYWPTGSPENTLTTPVRQWEGLTAGTSIDVPPERVTGLEAATQYSFRYCGREASETDFVCANTRQFWTQPEAGSDCRPELPDVTGGLQRWLDSIPDGRTATLEPGCYRLDGTLRIENRTDLILDGSGATFRSYPGSGSPERGTRPHIQLTGNTNVTVRNLTIDGGAVPGYEPATQHQHAFDIDWCGPEGSCATAENDGVRLLNVAANRVKGDFVYIRRSDNVEIAGARFGRDDNPETPDGNGRQGIAVVGGSDIDIHDTEISNAPRAILDIEPNLPEETVSNVTFRDNVVRQTNPDYTGLTFFANKGADARVEHIHVLNNTLIGRRFWVGVVQPNQRLDRIKEPADYQRFDYRFIGNTSDTPTALGHSAAAVHIYGVRQALLWDNDVVIGNPTHPELTARFVDARRSYSTSVWANTVTSHEGGEDDLADYSVGKTGYYLLEDWLDCTVSPCVQRHAFDDISAEAYESIRSLSGDERPEVASVDLATRDMCERDNEVAGATPPPELPTPGTYECTWDDGTAPG